MVAAGAAAGKGGIAMVELYRAFRLLSREQAMLALRLGLSLLALAVAMKIGY